MKCNIVLFILHVLITQSRLDLCAIWAGRNTQSTIFLLFGRRWSTRSQLFFCSLAGDGLVCGCYQTYPYNTETIRYVAMVKRKVLTYFSESTQLKFSNLNTRSKFLAGDFLVRVYFRWIRFRGWMEN